MPPGNHGTQRQRACEEFLGRCFSGTDHLFCRICLAEFTVKLAILGSRGYPYVYSGYETFVAALAARLVARGHEVVVYCHRGLFDKRPAK